MLAQILFLGGFLLAIIAVIQLIAARGWMPESTLLALVGLALGGSYTALARFTPDVAAQLDPFVTAIWPTQAYLWIFLPPLIFQAALTANVRAMIPDAAPILLLAVIAVFVATALIGFSVSLVSVHTLAVCLLLGAAVSTTDPSAVIAVFRSLGAPARLTRLVEGESLLNDAAAIAIVGILTAMLGNTLIAPGVSGVATTLALSIAGGGLAGYVVGRVIVIALPLLDRSPVAAATLTLAVPYPLYIAADEMLHASGVIAVVAAGLVISALGPTRLSPRNWSHMHVIWRQFSVLAGAGVFLLAAMRVPPLLRSLHLSDLTPIIVAFVAALVARLATMFALLPVLSWFKLSDPVDTPYKLAISWGGLRGAVTLILALSIAENQLLPLEDRQFVGALACAFTLASLFINGLSLRWVITRLGLTRLSPQQEALQRQAALLSVAEVDADITRIAGHFSLSADVLKTVCENFRTELAAGTDDGFAIENALTERERLSLGLTILAAKEHSLIPEYGSGVISTRNLDVMVQNTSQMIDAVRLEGRIGYNRAAASILDEPLALKVGAFLARYAHIDTVLKNALADRFELVICRRAVLEQLIAFNARALSGILGSRMASVLDGVLRTRLAAVDQALADLRIRYGGDFARALERRLLLLSALRRGTAVVEALQADSIVSPEIASNITRTLDRKWRSVVRRPPLNLRVFAEDCRPGDLSDITPPPRQPEPTPPPFGETVSPTTTNPS